MHLAVVKAGCIGERIEHIYYLYVMHITYTMPTIPLVCRIFKHYCNFTVKAECIVAEIFI